MQSLPPYAVRPPTLRFRALTLLAGRLALGGPREIAMAALMGARLAHTAHQLELPLTTRRARAAAARGWGGALSVPAPVRAALLRVIQATEDASLPDVRLAVEDLAALSGPVLDSSSALELKRFLQELRATAEVSRDA